MKTLKEKVKRLTKERNLLLKACKEWVKFHNSKQGLQPYKIYPIGLTQQAIDLTNERT